MPDHPPTPPEGQPQAAPATTTTAVNRAEAALLEVPEFSPLPPGAETEIASVQPKTKEPTWNPDQYTASVQSKLAFRLIWVLVGVLLGGAALVSTTKWTGLAVKDVTNFFGVAFAAVVTLATAATSFWFGSQRAQSKSGTPQ